MSNSCILFVPAATYGKDIPRYALKARTPTRSFFCFFCKDFLSKSCSLSHAHTYRHIRQERDTKPVLHNTHAASPLRSSRGTRHSLPVRVHVIQYGNTHAKPLCSEKSHPQTPGGFRRMFFGPVPYFTGLAQLHTSRSSPPSIKNTNLNRVGGFFPLPQPHHKSPFLGLSTRSHHVLSRVIWGVGPDGLAFLGPRPRRCWKR